MASHSVAVVVFGRFLRTAFQGENEAPKTNRKSMYATSHFCDSKTTTKFRAMFFPIRKSTGHISENMNNGVVVLFRSLYPEPYLPI